MERVDSSAVVEAGECVARATFCVIQPEPLVRADGPTALRNATCVYRSLKACVRGAPWSGPMLCAGSVAPVVVLPHLTGDADNTAEGWRALSAVTASK